jgi:hypothetical protein
MAMYEALAVQIRERIQSGPQHLPNFFSCKRPLRQKLRKIFVRVLHDHKEQFRIIDRRAACLENLQKMRMG